MKLGRALLIALYRLAPEKIYERPASLIAPGRILLDVGGARGTLAYLASGKFELSIVVDVDPAHFPRARRGGVVEFVCASGCHLPLRSGSVDSAVFHDSLHHLESPREGIGEAARVLREGGFLYVFDFDGSKPMGRVIRLFERIVGFPGNLLALSELGGLLEGFSVLRLERGRFSSYTLVATKRTTRETP
ncbi:class I SAM-dependent methyltransferase [Infirmifilum lucidum]|uniref:Class I SAM-dependent methyltransferase n=1 Tax=Infirmifilum lucidum TaxID=2776706 RepID=A0A7L9FJ95_9CREN|nr:class I SAM-dependent methyltransferase [Infirmifilum lucidum]QOJ78865.1 class I SAM-dependent methyltransferase [Infirmifilum lucidum]